jgi:hypothetical protein
MKTTVFWDIRRGSSVSIVSGYGLDDRTIQVRSLAEAKDSSFNLFVQTDQSPPSRAEVMNE